MHELLDAGLADPAQDPALRAHLQGCPECRSVVQSMQSIDLFSADLEAGVLRPVLAATSGQNCSRVQEFLADGEPADHADHAYMVARGWVDQHVLTCDGCAAVARVLTELPQILPTLASRDPGPDFTADVLLATLPRPSLWAVFGLRAREHLARWSHREEFAQEFSFALTVLLVAVCALPGSPLRELPRQALSIVQAAAAAEAPAEGTVGGQLRQGLNARGERLEDGFDRLGTHVLGTGRGLVDGDLEVMGENAGRIGCDLQRLWEGVRSPAVDPDSICG